MRLLSYSSWLLVASSSWLVCTRPVLATLEPPERHAEVLLAVEGMT